MDFLEKFDYYFKLQHGDEIYNEICELIKKENPENYDSKYVTFIFKVSFFMFIGNIDIIKLGEYFKDNCQIVDLEKTIKIHNNSIDLIKKYLNSSLDEELELLKN